jgi:hypothetical protein
MEKVQIECPKNAKTDNREKLNRLSMCIERGREERKKVSIHTIKIHA